LGHHRQKRQHRRMHLRQIHGLIHRHQLTVRQAADNRARA
jgi:uncharacterized protein YggL (DUF469 family)